MSYLKSDKLEVLRDQLAVAPFLERDGKWYFREVDIAAETGDSFDRIKLFFKTHPRLYYFLIDFISPVYCDWRSLNSFLNSMEGMVLNIGSGNSPILMDAVWNAGNWRGQFLWSLDRGSFPKTEGSLRRCISERFLLCKNRKWKIHHEYALFWSKKA